MEKSFKTSENQRRASQRYRDKLTPEQRTYNSARTASQTFARKHARNQDDVINFVNTYLLENVNAEGEFQKLWQELIDKLK
ncbi:hypothetical protein FACS1894193_05970 [Bacilli bacterium]|nr:hypothetical protein FACS1894192_07330 [Bacilli bacterium]GHU41707.1 hypothetical protein FACS1894193_05970 [Bacilli bacterium]